MDWEWEEDLFMQRVHAVMRKANMSLVTQDEYDDAMKHDFNMGLDMEMNTDELDSDFIARWFHMNKHDSMFKDSADINKNVVIYRRGIGQATVSGFFLMEKVDILLGFVVEMALWLLSTIVALLSVWTWHGKFKSIQEKRRANQAKGQGGVVGGQGEGDDTDEDEEVETGFQMSKRSNIRQAVFADWTNLFRKVEKMEPTFKEMAIVYRLASEKPTDEDRKVRRVLGWWCWVGGVGLVARSDIVDLA